MMVVMGILLAYSLRCQLSWRDILVRHGKKPISPFFSGGAMLKNIKLTKELLTELTNESEIEELKQAQSRADTAIFLILAVFFILGAIFVSTGK